MAKFQTLDVYLDSLNDQAIKYYQTFLDIMNDIADHVKVRLFAGQVAFYIEENLKRTFHSSPVVVMAFFKDHVNIFASGNIKYKDLLSKYTFTEKGTMQIYFDQEINRMILKDLFIDSLNNL